MKGQKKGKRGGVSGIRLRCSGYFVGKLACLWLLGIGIWRQTNPLAFPGLPTRIHAFTPQHDTVQPRANWEPHHGRDGQPDHADQGVGRGRHRRYCLFYFFCFLSVFGGDECLADRGHMRVHSRVRCIIRTLARFAPHSLHRLASHTPHIASHHHITHITPCPHAPTTRSHRGDGVPRGEHRQGGADRGNGDADHANAPRNLCRHQPGPHHLHFVTNARGLRDTVLPRQPAGHAPIRWHGSCSLVSTRFFQAPAASGASLVRLMGPNVLPPPRLFNFGFDVCLLFVRVFVFSVEVAVDPFVKKV